MKTPRWREFRLRIFYLFLLIAYCAAFAAARYGAIELPRDSSPPDSALFPEALLCWDGCPD